MVHLQSDIARLKQEIERLKVAQSTTNSPEELRRLQIQIESVRSELVQAKINARAKAATL
jgi:hypothetical protein